MDSSVGKGLEYIVRGLLTRGRAGGGFRGGRATAGSPRPREMQARVSGVGIRTTLGHRQTLRGLTTQTLWGDGREK